MRALACLLVISLAPSATYAEAGVDSPSCYPGSFLPWEPDVPANLGAFVLVGGSYFEGALDIRLYEAGVTAERPVDISGGAGRWIVTPMEPLVEGSTYILVDMSCPGDVRETMYFVRPAVSEPSTLGVTSVSELRSSRSRAGAPLRYYVGVELVLSAEASNARALYEGARAIDGAARDWWPLDYSDVRVDVACDTGAGIAPGLRSFSHRARLLHEDVYSLASDPVMRQLVCAEAVRVHPVDEHVLTPEEIVEMDRIPDGGAFPDGGMPADASATSGGEGGGCGCRAAGRGTSFPGWLGLGCLLFVIARFRFATAAGTWLSRPRAARRGRAEGRRPGSGAAPLSTPSARRAS